MNIRVANLNDAEAISALSTHLNKGTSPDEMAKRLSIVLNKPDHRVYVYEDDTGKILAWIHACINITLGRGLFGEVLSFVVHDAFRGLGIGEKLFIETEQWIKTFNPTSVVVRSYKERARAHQFYNRYGYETNQVALEKWFSDSVCPFQTSPADIGSLQR